MKIAHQDENTLVLSSNWIALYILFASLLLCGTSYFTFLHGTEHRLICDRSSNTQVQCQLTQSFLGIALNVQSVEGLQGARLDVNPGSKSMKYQAILIVDGKERSFGEASNAYYEEKQSSVDAINAFFRSPAQPHLDVAVGGTQPPAAILLYFVLPLVILVIVGQDLFISWAFNRLEGSITHRRATLLGIRKKEYSLHDVVGVQINTGLARGGTAYGVALVMREGESIPLAQSKAVGLTNKEQLAATIREFLQLQ